MLRYQYTCPSCGLEYEFHKRVTITKRRCPHCNKLVTTSEIDRQEERRRERLFRQKLIGACVIGGVLLIGFIGNALSKKNTSSGTSASKNQDNNDRVVQRDVLPNPKERPHKQPDKLDKSPADPFPQRKNPDPDFPAPKTPKDTKPKSEDSAEREAAARNTLARSMVDKAKQTIADRMQLAEELKRIAEKYPDTLAGKDAAALVRSWAEQEIAEKAKVERDERLAAIKKQLDSLKPADRIAGLESVRKLDADDARPMASVICRLVFDSNDTVAAQALLALKVAAPTVYKHVSSIRTASRPRDLIGTMSLLNLQGDETRPAAPAVLWLLSHINPGDEHDSGVVSEGLKFLLQAEDTSDAHLNQAKRFCSSSSAVARTAAVKSLSVIAAARKEGRGANVKLLILMLNDDGGGAQALGGGGGSRLEAVRGLGALGSDAASALPRLKQLILDKDARIREAAAVAVEAIEKRGS